MTQLCDNCGTIVSDLIRQRKSPPQAPPLPHKLIIKCLLCLHPCSSGIGKTDLDSRKRPI